MLLEAADQDGRSPIDPVSFGRLLECWPVPAPTTLYRPNRYSLQISVKAADPPAAVAAAIQLWKAALRRTALPAWELARAEIVTPDELERELQAAQCDCGDPSAPSPVGHAIDVVGDELLSRALHDTVTGLPDRELFLDEVRRALPLRGQGPAVQAVIVAHVAQGEAFSAVDPCAVDLTADDVLLEIGRRLSDTVRRTDVVARVGASQFALLIEVPSANDIDQVVRRIVGSLRVPMHRRGRTLTLTPSVGVVMTSSGDDADEVIAMAETAMAVARKAGGDRYSQFDGHPRQASDDIGAR